VVIGIVAGCGRFDFDARGDGRADVATPCARWSSFDAPVRLATVSTAYSDWSPAPSPDGTLLAWSDWNPTDAQFDVGIAVADTTGAFTTPGERVIGLDTANLWEEMPTFTADGRTIVYTVENLASSQWSVASAPLVDATHAGASQTLFQSASYNTEPQLSADGLRLYLTTNNLPPTNGHLQLAVATRTSTSVMFGAAQVFAELDTVDNSAGETLSADELEMIFASDRPGGIGWALWRTTRAAIDQPFAAPQVVAELDSPTDELGPALSFDGTTLELNYDAIYSGGNSDLWVSRRSCLGP
jgi:hypothetical protein